MRNPCTCTSLCALRLPNHRPRRRERRHLLLLCELRQDGRCEGTRRPSVTTPIRRPVVLHTLLYLVHDDRDNAEGKHRGRPPHPGLGTGRNCPRCRGEGCTQICVVRKATRLPARQGTARDGSEEVCRTNPPGSP